MTFMQISNENYSTLKAIMLLKILEKSDLLDIQRSAMTHCNPQEILARPLEAQFVCRSNGYGVTQCQSWVCYKFHYVQKKHNSNKIMSRGAYPSELSQSIMNWSVARNICFRAVRPEKNKKFVRTNVSFSK